MSAENYTVDKTGWPEGPWLNEPDKVQWRTAVGLPGLIVRSNPSIGNLCGYVGVPPGHPLHGVGYTQCPQDCGEFCCEHSPESRFEIHGGLTYSAPCMDNGPICHIPEPGEPADVWWFGFDAGHSEDVSPGMLALELQENWPPDWLKTYRDLGYMREQVERLATQLHRAASRRG